MSTYAVVNPATGETVAEYPTFTDAEVEAAVAKAHAGFATWRAVPPAERAAVVRKAAGILRERAQELGAVIVREMGKPIEFAVGEVEFSADILEFYCDNVDKITADQPLDITGEGSALVRRAPLGVLLGIMPWNFPHYQVARFAGPNLVLGNTILLKHAPQCPESAELIEQIFAEAGLPEGAYVNVRMTNEQSATVIADPRVQGVSVTGSERAGSAVAALAGQHLKKVALELGGSDPFILLSTDDLDQAVQDAITARMESNGQACNAAKRFLIVDELYDAFVEKFTAAFTAIETGDPTLADTQLGPLVSVDAAERLQEQVDRAVAQGATLVAGGKRDGAYFPTTILTDVTPEMDVYREELFGPVAVLHRVKDERAAIELANDTPFGLGSYVYTTDPVQAERVADAIDAGMVYINIVAADAAETPFGGVKRSGTSRELGLLAADEFVNKKLIRIGG